MDGGLLRFCFIKNRPLNTMDSKDSNGLTNGDYFQSDKKAENAE